MAQLRTKATNQFGNLPDGREYHHEYLTKPNLATIVKFSIRLKSGGWVTVAETKPVFVKSPTYTQELAAEIEKIENQFNITLLK
tara:strand:+ start:1079 stop:1330 length:252 start_codon:yes stop_codon:yes gene_type:complete